MSELSKLLQSLNVPGVALNEEASTENDVRFSCQGRSFSFRMAQGSLVELYDATTGHRLELFETGIGANITVLTKDTMLNGMGLSAAPSVAEEKGKKDAASPKPPQS